MQDAYSDWLVTSEGGTVRAYAKSWVEEEDSTTATVYIWGCAECYDAVGIELETKILVGNREVGSSTASITQTSNGTQLCEMEGRMIVAKKEEAQTIAASCIVRIERENPTGEGESEDVAGGDVVGEDASEATSNAQSAAATVLITVDSAVISAPETPTDLIAVRNAAATITLTWTNNSQNTASTIIERMERGGGWTEILITRQVLTQYTDTPGAGEYKYRVRYLNAQGYSGYSNETDYIKTLCAPAPPTLVSPASGAIIDAGQRTVRLAWVHNPIDASAQTSAEVATSLDGETYQTLTVGDDQACALPVSGNTTVYWRVRTKGLHADFSPWSGVSSFLVRVAPVVALHAPETITGLPFTVSWTYEDELGTQISAALEIYDSVGEKLCAMAISGQRQEWTIDGSEFTPVNGKRYTLRLTATSSTSLTATSTVAIKADYDAPAKPNLALAVNKAEHSVKVTVFAGQQAEAFLETASLSVFRDDVLIAQNLSSGQTVRDRIPPLDRQVTYKAIAYAFSGSANERRETIVVRSRGNAVFNFGDDYAQIAKVSLNLSESDETEGEKETYQIASSKYPKVFYGERSTRTGNISGDALWASDMVGNGKQAMLAAIEALKEYNGLVYMRLPYRDAFTVDCNVQIKRSSDQYNIAAVSIDWQAVDG